jgi:fatty acid desaturase
MARSTLMATQLDARQKQKWSEPSDLYGWSAVLRNTLPLFGLLWLAPILADSNPYFPWMLVPLVGLLIYRITVVMHDCTHHTLFKSRRLNKVIGSLLGATSGVDFRSFSNQHWRHHLSYGETEDPQGFHYANLRSMTPGQFFWHVVKPLLGSNLRNTFPESVLAPKNLARLVVTGEFAIVVLVQAALLAVVTGFGRHKLLAALSFVSAATFGLFFSQLRGIAEHGVIDSSVDTRNVRSHASNWLDRILLYDVNFNFHREHHEYPEIPSCHLPAMHLEANTPSTSGSMFRTLRAMYMGTRRLHA